MDRWQKALSEIFSHGLTVADIMRETGCSVTSVYMWKWGKATPIPAHRKALIEFAERLGNGKEA